MNPSLVNPISLSPEKSSRTETWLAWAVMGLCSLLPNILWIEITHQNGFWLFWGKVILLSVLIVLTFPIKAIRTLRPYFVILLGIFAFEEFGSWLGAQPFWMQWFLSQNPSGAFLTSMLSTQLLRLATSLLMIALLLFSGFHRKQFFLTPGFLKAPITPVPWLGFPKVVPWTSFGGQYAVYISLGTLAFLVIAGRPMFSSILQALPMLPMILALAALNAFNEEMTYRSSIIATLEPVIGPRSSLWIAALFFGIGHFYGVPYGVIGVLLASFLGWFLGKAMLETRGFFWPWFIHFLQDVAIFLFMAIGSVTPGG